GSELLATVEGETCVGVDAGAYERAGTVAGELPFRRDAVVEERGEPRRTGRYGDERLCEVLRLPGSRARNGNVRHVGATALVTCESVGWREIVADDRW